MKRIVCIVGPTGSGKTAMGIALAKDFNGEVVSADSRMVYRGMEIGTAVPKGTLSTRPAKAGLGRGISETVLTVEGVPHYLVGIVEPNQPFTVVDWKQQAVAVIEDMLNRGKLPIIVGGTGLYFSTLLDNFEIPPGIADMNERTRLEAEWKTPDGKQKLIQELLALDPDVQELVDLDNPRRVIRALEVCKATGKSFTQQLHKNNPLYDALEIGIHVPKEELGHRLSGRTQEQLRNGLLDEVRRLKQRFGCDVPAMQGFVYKEMSQYLDGNSTLEKAIELIDLRNRQYAKRQMTWFRRDKRIRWIENTTDAHVLVRAFLD